MLRRVSRTRKDDLAFDVFRIDGWSIIRDDSCHKVSWRMRPMRSEVKVRAREIMALRV